MSLLNDVQRAIFRQYGELPSKADPEQSVAGLLTKPIEPKGIFKSLYTPRTTPTLQQRRDPTAYPTPREIAERAFETGKKFIFPQAQPSDLTTPEGIAQFQGMGEAFASNIAFAGGVKAVPPPSPLT